MTEPAEYPYATHLDVKFAPLSVVDVPALVAQCKDRWYNQTLCKVNDSVIRLGVMQGEYHWHKHDDDDEFFFVLEGLFLIDLEPKAAVVRTAKVAERRTAGRPQRSSSCGRTRDSACRRASCAARALPSAG